MSEIQNGVSIIIPTYNESTQCLEALKDLPSMEAVTEVIIVDASDNRACQQSLTALERVAGFKLITTEGKGRGLQMNAGATEATTSVLLFLHADSQLNPEAAKAAINALEAGYYWGRFDTQLMDERWQFRVIEWAMNRRSAMTHVATGDQALFMAREAFDIVEGFDEIALMEDVAMSKKLKRIGPICAVPMKVKTSARRWQQLGIFKTIGLMWWLRFRYFLGAPPSQLAKSYQQIRALPPSFSNEQFDCPVYLFAKAPEPGRVKNRLCPPLNANQAAEVATLLLNNITKKLTSYWRGHTVLAVTPDIHHLIFKQLQDKYALPHIQQVGSDLGERMLNALTQGVESSSAAAVIGADIPSLTEDILLKAYESMQQGQCVVGPTTDGGFYFLGLTVVPETLFANIEWGGEKVYSQLMMNAAELNIQLIVLPTLQDCDYWQDVESLIEQVPRFGDSLKKMGIDAALYSSKK